MSTPTPVDAGILRQYIEPRPNPMFSPEQTAATRFVRYKEAVPCAHCGKRSKHHWTSLVRFKSVEFGAFSLKPSRKWLPAGTPVCRAHPMQPDMKEVMRAIRAARAKRAA